MSKFIVIEGPDRVGKATQTRLLRNYLRNSGNITAMLEVPVKSNVIYHLIYWMLGNGLAKKFPKIFQWFQYFNRQIFQWTTLPHLEKSHDFIVMDRWSLSTVIYGAATDVPKDFTEKLYKRLREPDFTIILLGPAHKHEAEDVYESDNKLQQKVRDLYRSWAETNPSKSIVIDCTLPREDISNKILNVLKEFDVLHEDVLS